MSQLGKSRGWFLLGLTILLCLLGVSLRWSRQNVDTLTRWHNSKLAPVSMIPGSSATENRFDGLVRALNTNNKAPHSLVKILVTRSNQIQFSGGIRQGDNEPIIVVGFENNRDGYANIQQQARQFNLVFRVLTERYNFNHFKAIGHSNGGLIYTDFLERYFSRYADRVEVTKLMTIGSPFNFNENSMKHQSTMLSDFIAGRHKLPRTLSVYSVAGTQTYTSDGLVPLGSVMAGRYVYQEQVRRFTTITVSGSNAQHSSLPQNQEIVDLINRYILDRPISVPTRKNMPFLNGR